MIPLYQVKVSLNMPRPIRQITLQPQGSDPLEYWEAEGRIEFVVPKVNGTRWWWWSLSN